MDYRAVYPSGSGGISTANDNFSSDYDKTSRNGMPKLFILKYYLNASMFSVALAQLKSEY